MDAMAAIFEWDSFSNSESQCCSDASPPSFGSILHTCMVPEMSFEEFQYGCHRGHLGYRNGTILAVLNLHFCPDASHQVSIRHVFQ